MDTIKVIPRSKENGNRNKLLEDSKIPCVIYGKGSKSESLSIELKTISTLVKTNTFYSKVLSIELNGKKEKVLPKEVQYHPVSSNIIHVDFMRVQDSTKVTVEVPVNFLNKEKCIGIKQGGVLNIVRRSVELICNASVIPDKLEYDLINSEIGDSIKISSIVLPEGVKPSITDRDFVIANVVPPTVEVEPEKPESEEAKEGEETDQKAEGEQTAKPGTEKKESATEPQQKSTKKEEQK